MWQTHGLIQKTLMQGCKPDAPHSTPGAREGAEPCTRLCASHPPDLWLLQSTVTLISHARRLNYHIGNKFKLRTLALPNPNIQKS